MDARCSRVMGTVLWFALLAERPLFDPDEGRYAEIPREMLSGGDWVIPHLDALVYLEKPPLQYWLTALTLRVLGENEFAARLCTGLAGYLSLATVFLLGRKLWGFDAGVRALCCWDIS
jgi:4-amino-4-deoxy-L-arabinose transferase-like glycosyltransferase